MGVFNQVRGLHHGLAIGIVNYAEELQGLQIGVINIARNNPSGARVLPLVNAHSDAVREQTALLVADDS